MNAPTLFPLPPIGRARRTDPDTSQRAARRVNVKSLRDRIVHAYDWWGPMTDDELCGRLQEPERRWPSIKTARSALTHCDPPLLVYAGKERNGQRVWRAKSWPPACETVDIAKDRL